MAAAAVPPPFPPYPPSPMRSDGLGIHFMEKMRKNIRDTEKAERNFMKLSLRTVYTFFMN
jgi:hypothetical protein